jgi:hypothetical protein
VVIALAALIVSVREGISSRKHHRLSVKPVLLLEGADDEDAFWASVGNHGLGPAVITQFRIVLNPGTATEDLVTSFPELFRRVNLLTQVQFWFLSSGETVAPGNQLPLFRLSGYSLSSPVRDQLKEVLRQVEFRISYASLYGERFTLSVKVPFSD